MKKIILTLLICSVFTGFASAQVIPNFEFGVKGGMNLAAFPQSGVFNNSNQAGYVGGVWARFGALGFNFQPELYLTGKDVNTSYSDNNQVYTNKVKFTSLDLPLLFGGKIGAFGFGARFYTGPVVSFAINKDQTLSDAAHNAGTLEFKNQNYAWQFGGGVDIRSLSIDLRYEAGLNKVAYGSADDSHTRINLFSLTLAYKLFSL
ncbi:Outer membrane protein beta-barrel domain-containing protein [Mucilaginibacter mallensis]|uniref:Outer membrane protein beta-barrel domain-containing protein n=1 Tax=Mucilaginibacter mallensis TaxID=652787 RepID=A0A1H1Z767_MUCMA|nr:porin family protein [Mucilaginibacter mallensis]SDT29463.1 Outer membrane protein beta-barrel domain-containing protein [Mucilaginibacter mallensis]